jgi:NTP pyrophosphatase (non-canonical NTP hydrolase)
MSMDLSSLVTLQIDADRRRNFPTSFATDELRYAQLASDLVGLYGEVGEFSNIAKKIGLRLGHPGYDGPTFAEANADLREELADAFIYLIRIATIIGADLEKDVLEKMAANDDRYRRLESN